ncbi:MAG: iron dependent repressor, metal binding and dimerization domain protein, partial [Candidatus Caldatribacteriota bacterium]|nr:iron dependent repressor, metal binding and dimerization domain protein [Candidatus Caldatribacteriota bacterium]
MEDYLEAILNLQNDKGYVRVKDIADRLEVKCPSVSEMIKKLDKNNYILCERYGGIVFTAKGKKIAREIKRRHNLFVKFLRIIGVSEKNSQKDACKLEHDVSSETITCLFGFIGFIQQLSDNSKLKKYFEEYFKKEKFNAK